MSDTDRQRLRDLQDRWLSLPVIRNHIRNHGEHQHIGNDDSPTFADVKAMLLPEWEQWFNDYFT